MHECCYLSRSQIFVDLQFVFVNLLNFCFKQMQLAFVLWFKRSCWPNFTAFVAKAQSRVATLMFGLFV